MVKNFLTLEWKSFFRSASFGKSIALKIFLILLGLYFAAMFLILGVSLYPILIKFFPDQDPVKLVNRFVLGWFLVEFMIRFNLQTLPVLDIKPLLNLPIPRRKVVNFVLIKSLHSFYNFLPLFIIIPFGVFCILKSDYSTISILAWMLALIAMTLCVNYLNFIVKKRFTDNLKALIPVVFVIGVLFLLDYLEIFQISVYFGKALNLLLIYPALALVPVVFLILLFKWNQKNLEAKFYLDGNLKGKQKAADTNDFVWTKKFGDIAPFLKQDLKLIWRNKRPKTTIYISLLFLAYGLIFYTNDAYDSMPAFYIFIGIFITGVFMINFGQFIPAWDSSYYQLIMAQNIQFKHYLASKAGLLTFSVIVLGILATPYVYFGWDILLINVVCAIYNIGVNVPVLLFAGSFNKKKIDLDKSPFMNYQGTGAAQWLVGIPLMVIPVLIFWLINKYINFEAGLTVLGAMGALGLFLRPKLLENIAMAYTKRKYATIQGFKQTGE